MREEFNRDAEVKASRDLVWELLNDVDALANCSSRVRDVTSMIADQEWSLILTDRVGPLTLSAPMSVSIVERSNLQRVTIAAEGHDRALGTRLYVEASISCAEASSVDLTRVALDGSFTVTGKAANLGSSIVRRQANSMIDEFWLNFTNRLHSP